MRENNTITVEKSQSNLTRWGLYALILLLVFLMGFIPMWLQKRDVAQQLDATQKQLRKSEIKGLLTTAIVEAKSGEYEVARRDASEFFTRLRAEIDKSEQSALIGEERGKLKTIFDNRDSTITMLAQRDQASTERLTDIFVNYQTAIGQPPAASPTLDASPAASPVLAPAAQPTP